MSFSSKIFITFFISVTILLLATLYLIDTRTEQHTIDHLIIDLNKVQEQFQRDLNKRQKHIQTLARIITTDQKFRSFLSQIKDNFYPFTEEIAKDTEADYVYMLDDKPAVRAKYKKPEKNWLNLEDKFKVLDIDTRLDQGVIQIGLVNLGEQLLNSYFIPLKENLNDDYAIGMIIIFNQLNDAWVEELLGTGSNLHAVFFNGKHVVAKNTSHAFAEAVIQKEEWSKDTKIFLWDQQRYIVKKVLFAADIENAGYMLSVNLDILLLELKELQKQILLIGGGVLLLGALLFLIISYQVTQPVRMIRNGTQAISDGNFQYRIKYLSQDEIGQLASAFNQMAIGLEEKEKIRNTFNQYVDPAIVAEILSKPEKLKMGGQRIEQSVLFSDIEGFTNFSENMPAEDLVNLLNEYLTLMTRQIADNQGILDKYIGDAIMAFWNPEICGQMHAQLACQAALSMQMTLDTFRAHCFERGFPEINTRIGISSGEMIVGNIGSEQAKSYTCIGDKVNYSSRLEGLNKYYQTQIIIDQQTSESIYGFLIRKLDRVKVKGRGQGEDIFELVSDYQSSSGESKCKVKKYEQALELYFNAQFMQAGIIFERIENDHASKILRQRCLQFQTNPPVDWDGIHTMTSK